MCDLTNHFKAIDTEFEKESTAIVDAIEVEKKKKENQFESLTPSKNDLFETPVCFTVVKGALTDIIPKKPGIYIFVLTPPDNNPILVNEEFNETDYAPRLNKGDGYYKKDNGYNPFRFGEILYLGKSESNLNERLNEHINGPSSASTYALRLSSTNRSFLLGKLHCICLVLKSDYEKYKKTILPSIESRLHDSLKPRVGSKRS